MVDTLFPNDHTISPYGVSSHYPTQSLTFYHFRCFPLTRRQFRYLNKTRAIDRGKNERRRRLCQHLRLAVVIALHCRLFLELAARLIRTFTTVYLSKMVTYMDRIL